eukprot:s1083_g3.t1
MRTGCLLSQLALVIAQDADCSEGGALCCVLKYDGARNFFNSADSRCEAVAHCGPSEDYDAQANRCIAAGELTAVTESQTTTGVLSSGTSTTLPCEQQAACCLHGAPDALNPNRCVCEEGWLTLASAEGMQCSTPVSTSAASTSPGEVAEDPPPADFMSMAWGAWGFMMSNGGLVLLVAVIVLCCCFCCLLRSCCRRGSCCWCCCWGGRQKPMYAPYCWPPQAVGAVPLPMEGLGYAAPPHVLWQHRKSMQGPGPSSMTSPVPRPLPPPISSPLVHDRACIRASARTRQI